MRRLLPLSLLLAGCGGGIHTGGFKPDAMEIAASCESDFGWTLQLEPGVSPGDPQAECGFVERLLSGYQAAYEQAWGSPGTEGWLVRIRREPLGDAPAGQFVAGETWSAEHMIELFRGSMQVFAHELHHVALGPSSTDHHGLTCPGGFGEWEKSQGLFPNADEYGYLPKCVAGEAAQ